MKRILLLLTIAVVGCHNANEQNNVEENEVFTKIELQSGDILFQDLDCGDACDAIEAVTEGVNGWDFSHCGIVVNTDSGLMVVEAYGKVDARRIDTFLNRSIDSIGKPKVVAGRVKPQYSNIASSSADIAKGYIGKEYDNAFKLGDDKYYCSELVYECYKQANDAKAFFPLNVMTFKAPGTDTFMPFWVEYYKELRLPIPEGDSGINPGAISRSELLEIHELN